MALEPLLKTAVRAFGALPPSIHKKLAGESVRVEGEELHPAVKLALKALNAGGPTFETKPLDQGRAELKAEASIFGTAPELDSVKDILIPGGAGKVGGRVYVPGSKAQHQTNGVVMYMHGGGWVLGGFESADAICRALALHTGLTFISIDYRLAPENPFPAGLEDCLAAYRWIRENAEQFSTSADRVSIAGESAGGNLTCVIAQQLGANEQPKLALPIFPVTDLSKKSRSYELFSSGYFLTEAQMDWYKNHYLPDSTLANDPRVSPLLAEDVSNLCPHIVVVAGFDPLRDEGLAYAEKLKTAGTPTELIYVEGFIHAFVNATALGKPVMERIGWIGDKLKAHYS